MGWVKKLAMGGMSYSTYPEGSPAISPEGYHIPTRSQLMTYENWGRERTGLTKTMVSGESQGETKASSQAARRPGGYQATAIMASGNSSGRDQGRLLISSEFELSISVSKTYPKPIDLAPFFVRSCRADHAAIFFGHQATAMLRNQTGQQHTYMTSYMATT